MTRTLTARRVRANLESLLEEVCSRGRAFVIARGGKPMAAVVPVSFLVDRTKPRDRFFRIVRKAWKRNSAVPSRILRAEVEEAVRAARRKAARSRR